MRQTTPRRARPGSIAFTLLVVAICLLAFAAPALASSSPEPAAASPSAAAEPAPNVLTSVLSSATVVYGDAVTVTGTLTPAGQDQKVVVTVGGAEVGTDLTDASGAYEVTFTPRRGGDVVATLDAEPTIATAPLALSVKPRIAVSHGALVPFLASRFVVKVTPSAYDGVVVIRVTHRGATVGSYRARVKDGRAVFQIPLRGVDAFTLNVTAPAASGLAGRTVQAKVSVRAKTLSAGSSGPYVKAMLTGLQRLKFRVPGVGSTFTASVKDSVVAFQKAYRLSRTYVFNTACWRKLDGAKLIKPKYSSPSTHIEIDKTRQILMIVKGGQPLGIICVSTGATGNTPEGSFRIQQKHPYTSSGFGGTLTRTMGFQGNFAIHGWPDVPPYPASHGCVREPIWACYWTYDQSWVGEAVYVYR